MGNPISSLEIPTTITSVYIKWIVDERNSSIMLMSATSPSIKLVTSKFKDVNLLMGLMNT